MKRKIALLFALSSGLAALALAAFANNVAAIVRWWRGFLASGGDGSAIPAKVSGVVPWLDWSVVDYSAVSTLIPALGFLSIALSLLKLLRGHRMPPGDFPFFKGSDQLNIALGLFGTLWGIIVIGYFKLDTVSMADLMQCLHTALFSTLVAVVWVFMLDRPLLRPYFTRLLLEANLAETDESDLSAAVERLVRRLDEASEAFDRRQRGYEEAFERRLAKYEREFDMRQKEYSEFFMRRIGELEKSAAESAARADAAGAKLDAVAAVLSRA